MNYDTSVFKKNLHELNIDLSDNQVNQFLTYYEMLIDKNKVINLTAITDFDEVVEKHFIDSLALIKIINLDQQLSILDLGTGAGFPGIPLKIAFPKLKVILADSLNKRLVFLDEVISSLDLKNISTVHGRAEDLARMNLYRENFDLCVSRAVANLSTLSEYCIPFVKVGGQFISYKSAECNKEVDNARHAISLLGGKVKEIQKFEIGDSGRAFVSILKEKSSPKKYPRKAGVPSKMPL
ncbi:MAG: 16S rRNA (guanine(527)-N(7))-methyltransferase RsmG [Agathobacter sp.]|nr:16S rRNA (guanine(527)-N(7))-methyltransferase RsmG [Agathobacter sp.]